MALQFPVAVDRGYLNLLAHLREKKLKISADTLQAALCHYLVHLPSTQPSPAPLTASILASPVWYPLTLSTCLELGNTFRSAVRLKYTELKKKKRGIFDASIASDLATWTREIYTSLKQGDALIRMAVTGGLHHGLSDLADVKINSRLICDVEETMILAFAELTERASNDRWASEFKKIEQKSYELSVLLAARFFNSASSAVLSALDLTNLALMCLKMIENAFASGSYLHSIRESLDGDNGIESLVCLSQSSLETQIDALLASETFLSAPYLCRLVARIVAILSESSLRMRIRKDLWRFLDIITLRLNDISCHVEEDWRSTLLAEVRSEDELDDKTRKSTEKIWKILKTQLFSSLMLQQAVLDSILYLSPPSSLSAESETYSATRLSSIMLRTLCSLSFIIASFGGVTAGPAQNGNGPAFPELKKVFYMAIDILCSDVKDSEVFVRALVADANIHCGHDHSTSSRTVFRNAKRSFILSCMEQFIPVLSDRCIEEVVLPFCEPHLGDASQRQTYEAAHSVMLSIFAAHAENTSNSSSLQSNLYLKGKGVAMMDDESCSRRLVPGYAHCLLENAKDSGLTTPQLRLAYAALVRSASTGRNPRSISYHAHSTSHSHPKTAWWRTIYNPDVDTEFAGDPALAWLCVEQLLQALAATPNIKSSTRTALSLTLVSLIPNVSLVLLPRLLDEVEGIVEAEADPTRRRTLLENIFEEILQRVGDAEREYAMKWWFERSKKWEASSDTPSSQTVDSR